MKRIFILPLAVFLVAFCGCKKDHSYPLNPLYDLDVPLRGEGKETGAGFIKFRQNADTARVVTLDTWVKHLLPNHSYLLQRAVNPVADPTGCSSTAWLTLGEGLVPKSILTDAHGDGEANLWRDISGIPRGTAFHIRFQIIDAGTMELVLSSDCFDYTVR
ncbi:MAG TPA: hypothetical protein VFV68_01800 [Agriterribacter sp.]|nr:hypothetical protein [Agriterribacter sp.]